MECKKNRTAAPRSENIFARSLESAAYFGNVGAVKTMEMGNARR
jgi:hypothetical protein